MWSKEWWVGGGGGGGGDTSHDIKPSKEGYEDPKYLQHESS